jgi:hypothetical protein
MANKPAPDMDVIIGVLNKVWPYTPATDDSKHKPGKMVIDTDDGEVGEIAFWPKSNFDTGELLAPLQFGDVWRQINPDRDEGRRLQIIAVPSGEYSGKSQYKNAKSMKFLDGAPAAPPMPAEAPVAAVQAPQASGYAPASRQEQGLALGNSKTGGSSLVAAYVAANKGKLPDAEWLSQAAACVNTYSTALLSGVSLDIPEEEVEEVEVVEVVPEVEDDDSGDDDVLATI